MNQALVITCSAAASTATCLLIVELLFGDGRRMRRRIHEAARRMGAANSRQLALFREWDPQSRNATNLLAQAREFVQQSGLPFRLWQVAASSCGSGLVGLGAGLWLTAHPAWGIPLSAAGVAGPWLFVWDARRRRVEQIAQQLPEAFDVMSRAVQAGQTLSSAFQIVSAECRDPVAREFGYCYEQQNLGLPHDAALQDLSRRIPIVELQMFVIALLVQRQCGGNPVELLNNMATLIRKRLRLAQRVRALTGEGRLQATVLTVLPVAAFAWLSLTRPDYIQVLLDRPRLLLGVVMLQVVGAIWVRKTVQVEY